MCKKTVWYKLEMTDRFVDDMKDRQLWEANQEFIRCSRTRSADTVTLWEDWRVVAVENVLNWTYSDMWEAWRRLAAKNVSNWTKSSTQSTELKTTGTVLEKSSTTYSTVWKYQTVDGYFIDVHFNRGLKKAM